MPTRPVFPLPFIGRVAEVGRSDRAGGLTLTAATVAALLWANLADGTYRGFWHLVPSWSHRLGLSFSLGDWVNQALMVGFFLLVGLEIRREATTGGLRTGHGAAVPVVAALAGMVVPALIYVAVMAGSPGAGGWGIPMATDVAFALSALAVVAGGAVPRLRVFLLTLAVADDVASIVVLACFYSRGIRPMALAVGVAGIVLMWPLRALRAAAVPVWLGVMVVAILGVVSWWALARAGVEAAIVGVAVGFFLPAGASPASSPEERERLLAPAVNLAVLPVFALANAGVSFVGSGLGSPAALRILAAVVVARVVGKPVGIAGVARAMGHGSTRRVNPGFSPREGVAVGALAAIGFTVPLLIVHVALPDGPLAAGATAGLLAASVIGALAGWRLMPASSSGP